MIFASLLASVAIPRQNRMFILDRRQPQNLFFFLSSSIFFLAMKTVLFLLFSLSLSRVMLSLLAVKTRIHRYSRLLNKQQRIIFDNSFSLSFILRNSKY